MTGAPTTPPSLASALAGDFTAHLAGDRDAAARLVRRASPLLWHLARSTGADTATAEDAVQNAFLALFRQAELIAEPKAVLKWLIVTTRREAVRLVTKRRPAVDDEALADIPAPRNAEPDAVHLERDRDRILWAAVRQLSQRCQDLLRLVAFTDRPDYAAVAASLDMRIGSIGPTRGRCLAKLRLLLDAEPGWSV